MKTLIAIPCMDMIHADFVRSLLSMEITGQAQYTFAQSSLIYDARNQLAEVAVGGGFDRVLFLDSDMTFPSWTFKRLSELMDTGKSLVSGLYFGRRPPFGPIVYKDLQLVADGGAFPKPVAEVYEDFPEDTVFPAKAVGFGCVMLSVDLLKKVGAAYGTGFCPISGFGEDLSFCLRAGELGETVWVDSALKCGHVGLATYTEDTWRAYRKRGEDT